MEQLKKIDRFMRFVLPEPNSGCWLWAGYVKPDGYPQFGQEYAHRFAYTEIVGPIPEGLELDHLCRVRSCVNPNHLEAVTHLVNISRVPANPLADANRAKTHCPYGHPYDGQNLWIESGRARRCRTCRNAEKIKYSRARRGSGLKHVGVVAEECKIADILKDPD